MKKSFRYRFREILSDPINLKINRHPLAGTIENDFIYMHNGLKVYRDSYYEDFSDIFILNGGVHEPQEEYAFQIILEKIQTKSPVMIELGSYWAFYSMWFLKKFPNGKSYLIEPGDLEIESGKRNFELNNLSGEFIKSKIGDEDLSIDDFVQQNSISKIDILHSDIQGFEHQMLVGASKTLSESIIDYLFISTHSFGVHRDCIEYLNNYEYHIISSVYPEESYCCDGIIVAQKKIQIDLGKKDKIISEEELDKIWTAKNM